MNEAVDAPMKELEMSTLTNLDGAVYLYGHPLHGSLSPLLHQTIFDTLRLNWRQIPLSHSERGPLNSTHRFTRSPPIERFLQHIRNNPKFRGSAVTMPWKVEIMPHLDELTEEAEQCGACNTIFIRQDPHLGRKTLIGTNTDCIGMKEALLRNRKINYFEQGIANPYYNKPAMIVGGGGTARSAIYTLRNLLGCSKIYIVNRDIAEISSILEDRKKHIPPEFSTNLDIIPIVSVSQARALEESPEVIVSAIPNYPPKTASEVLAREIVVTVLGKQSKGVILEMCYHPLPWTEIADLASTAGWKVILGTESLIWQGFGQACLWTGVDICKNEELICKVQKTVNNAVSDKIHILPRL